MNQYEHAGWIHKQGSMIRTWKRRFMTLNDALLKYYDSDQITTTTKEKGKLKVITVEFSEDINNGLIIHGAGGRLLKIYTDSPENCNIWYNAIKRSCDSTGLSRQTSLYGENISINQYSEDDDQSSVYSEPLLNDSTGITMCGHLHKEGKRFKSWKRRYFTLKGNVLSYFESSEMGAMAKGSGEVTGVQIWEEKPFSLKIYFEEGRLLKVSADSQQDMTRWFQVLTRIVENRTAKDRQLNWVEQERTSRLSTPSPYLDPVQYPISNQRSRYSESQMEKRSSQSIITSNRRPDTFTEKRSSTTTDTNNIRSSVELISEESVDLDDSDDSDEGVWL